MFSFFRRYQRAIYFVITAVIILSFSFFGTYSAFTSGKGEDPVVFHTEEGRKMTRSEFNDYVHFLSSDSLIGVDGGAAPCNFLNDGVIPNDIIATGIGEVLVRRFSQDFQADLMAKFGRERTFQPYRHPQAAFVSAMQVWSYFAPDLKQAFEQFRALPSENPVDVYAKKADLFLAERRFPPMLLRQILAYQQQQFTWLEPDVALQGRPLGLFGYSQLTDWFGAPFIDRSCEFIIQTACSARAAGLSVSSGEALASLVQNVQKALQRFPHKDEITAEELFRRSLRELNMDQSRAVAIWTDVLLFRKALIELPLNIVVNTQPFDAYLRSESEGCDLECYQLQPSLRCASMRDVFKIELWLQGVAKRRQGASLMPPSAFLPTEEVALSWPEFVERKFVVNLTSVTFDDVAKKVRLRDIWNWETMDGNWELLVEQIPALAGKEAPTREDRLRMLDGLAPQLREKADTIAKEQMVQAHPEWLQQALAESKMEPKAVNIRLQGKVEPLEGITDRQALVSELMKAPIGEQIPSLDGYSQDGKHFYRIQVLDRAKEESLVALPDLLADGTLDAVLDRLLETAYPNIRSGSEFRKGNGEWKPFQEVKEKVGEVYFASLIKALDSHIATWKDRLPNYCHWDEAKSARVAVRFLPLLDSLNVKIEREGDVASLVTQPFVATSKETKNLNIEERPLKDLWLLVSSQVRFQRSETSEKPQFAPALLLDTGAWLPPRYSQELGPFIAKIEKKEVEPYADDLRSAVYDCQKDLGREAVMARSQQLVTEFFGSVSK